MQGDLDDNPNRGFRYYNWWAPVFSPPASLNYLRLQVFSSDKAICFFSPVSETLSHNQMMKQPVLTFRGPTKYCFFHLMICPCNLDMRSVCVFSIPVGFASENT